MKADVENKLSTKHLSVVARSKKKTCDILTVKGGYYISQIRSTRAKFVSEIVSEAKKASSRALMSVYRYCNTRTSP